MIEKQIKAVIRDVNDFPKEGIVFKDITPILLKPELCSNIVTAFSQKLLGTNIDVIVGIESRGFLFGLPVAAKMNVPFIPVRKKGKLPGETVSRSYELEYGTATIEVHKGDIKKGSKVLIHDDLLATGGTAVAVAELVQSMGSEIAAFSFIVSLDFLNGSEKLIRFSKNIVSLVNYE